MNAQEIRRRFLAWQKSFGHSQIARAGLVPENDPTTLFTSSGMQQLLKYLLGENHPAGNKLCDSQTCLRAQDIGEVGDSRHTTFFEMLGNWSLGDYFKAGQIHRFFSFLTDEIGLDPAKIYVTCFIGDPAHKIPRDDESAEIWQKEFKARGIDAKIAEIGSSGDGDRRGIKPGERIFFYDDGENWWSRSGRLDETPLGDPCGPDSEVFYDFGEEFHDAKFGQPHPASDSGRFMEIGNQVFMQYKRNQDGGFSELDKKNVDFGGGLERISAAAIGSPDIFEISLFKPIISEIEKLSGLDYAANQAAMRVIADHLRAATFLAVDGVRPSNKQQGYVMRRLIRRAVLKAFELGIEQNFVEAVVPVVVDLYQDDFPEIKNQRAEIIQILAKEEKVFRQTLRKGLKEFEKYVDSKKRRSLDPQDPDTRDLGYAEMSGEEIFKLYDTYGFPPELSTEEAFKREIRLSDNWRAEFDAQMAEQRAKSQTAAKGEFKGGLASHSPQVLRYHTATHLLQAALRQIFGNDLYQHGSNLNDQRLRFDFNLDRKMTDAEIKQVEDQVNQWIDEDLPVSWREIPLAQAKKEGAFGAFGDKYGDKVKVYQIGPTGHIVSLEICGGPHVDHTGQLKDRITDGQPDAAATAKNPAKFKIVKEKSSSAGVRRIHAILG
ncbi:MAG: alanine--tRNA ligase [Candidatus Nomurabacteria bacterium]|jgi:alanyl-tRNA synthetase|nr:alanine--tRNA ligase [Candidatus Nomurabacteria bacterium]